MSDRRKNEAEWVLLPRGVVGRDPAVEYWLDHSSVSRRHCEITLEDGGIHIRDLGSKGGTYINGNRIVDAMLGEGERLRTGEVSLQVERRRGQLVLRSLGTRYNEILTPDASLPPASETDVTVEVGRLREALASNALLLIELRDNDRIIREQSATGPYVLSSSVLRRVGETLKPVWAPRDLGKDRASFVGAADLSAYAAPIYAGAGRTIILYAYWAHGCPDAIGVMRTVEGAGEALGARAFRRWQRRDAGHAEAWPKPAVVTVPFVGHSEHFQRLLQIVNNVAVTDNPVVLAGARGCGKTTIAQLIHQLSSRREKPFLRCDCSSIPGSLFESELFGSVRGGFTGAVNKPGLLSVSHGGTLFLDSLESCPLDVQGKLKPVLDGAPFRRLGSAQEFSSDVRFVAAINESPAALFAAGRLQADLWDRLAVQVIRIPTLAERADDVPQLVVYYLQKEKESLARPIPVAGFSPEALRLLREYPWPGNIRQLVSVVKRIVAHVNEEIVQPRHVRAMIEMESQVLGDLGESPGQTASGDGAPGVPTAEGGSPDLPDYANLPLSDARLAFDRMYAQAVLEQTGGNITKAAQKMGVTRRSLYRILERCGLRLPPGAERELKEDDS